MGMKHYKLLKDTPTIKAGTIFEEVTSDFDELKELVRVTPIGAKTCPQFTIQDIDNFDEWFEKVEDSIHYKPKDGDDYFYISDYGNVYSDIWRGEHVDNERLALGFIYRTEKECEKARDRRLAEVRLQQTSDFKPDPNNGELGWIVGYSCRAKRLIVERFVYSHYGGTIHYKTAEDARKSIKENREDWLTYFGIKEEE
jgi:hypothetical protein